MDNTRTIMPMGRYTDAELSLLKTIFAEDDPKIKIIRKVMLQLPMSEAEEITWKTVFQNADVCKLMRKMFLPEIEGNEPIGGGQLIDLWMTVNLENKMIEEETALINSRKIVISYLENMLDVLTGETSVIELPFKDFDLLEPVTLRARQIIVAHIENQVATIKGLAGLKTETPEETVKRLAQNSNK